MTILSALNSNNFRFGTRLSENPSDSKHLFISINPDLKVDFGHFLNYEKRLRSACEANGIEHICLAHKGCQIDFPWLIPTFPQNSNHFSLMRKAAENKEPKITQEFLYHLNAGLDSIPNLEDYTQKTGFLYCGSSKLAQYLCQVSAQIPMPLIVNAFADFLEGRSEIDPAKYIHLKFDQKVSLLAMSPLHSQALHDTTGLSFDSIPNPPPLESDENAVECLARNATERPPAPTTTVFFPGLMSLGKGGDLTLAFIEKYLTAQPDFALRVRDRTGLLPADIKTQLVVEEGDFSDQEIKDLYYTSEIAVLPYEKDIFSIRTSGALVDCLMYGVVPIVMPGTWLAHTCQKYDFGFVAKQPTPDDLLAAIGQVQGNLAQYRSRQQKAAIEYLNDNSWTKLLDVILQQREAHTQSTDGDGQPRNTLQASADQTVRNGNLEELLFFYELLSKSTPVTSRERETGLAKLQELQAKLDAHAIEQTAARKSIETQFQKQEEILRKDLGLALRLQMLAGNDHRDLQVRYSDLLDEKKQQEELLIKLTQKLGDAAEYLRQLSDQGVEMDLPTEPLKNIKPAPTSARAKKTSRRK